MSGKERRTVIEEKNKADGEGARKRESEGAKETGERQK